MKVNYNMVVDFARPSKTNTIIISENDIDSRECQFTLLSDKKEFDMSDVSTVMVKGISSAGTTILDPIPAGGIVLDENGNKTNLVIYTINEEFTKYVGLSTAVVMLTSVTGETLTSFEFYIKVRNALYNEDDVVTEQDTEGFRALLDRVSAALEVLENNVQESALPNPKGLRISLDGINYDYIGSAECTVTVGDVAYLSEVGEIEDPISDGILQLALEYMNNAKASADSASASASIIQGIYYSTQDAINNAEAQVQRVSEAADRAEYILDNIQGIVPTVSVVKNDGVTTITITDVDGPHTSEIYDGAGGSGGGSGTMDYQQLQNQPAINGNTLEGDKSGNDLGLAQEIHTHNVSDIYGLVVPTIVVSDKVDGKITVTVTDKSGTKSFDLYDGLPGAQGAPGATGTANKWYQGAEITGNISDTVVSGSGVLSALKNDMYLNIGTGEVYYCTLGGNANTAKWTYALTLSGGGSGSGGGASTYGALPDKPSINSCKLIGNVSTADIGAADRVHTHTSSDITDWDNAVSNFATKADTLAGYGIADAMTAEAIANAIEAAKPDLSTGKLIFNTSGGQALGEYTVTGVKQNKTITIPIPDVTASYSEAAGNANKLLTMAGLKGLKETIEGNVPKDLGSIADTDNRKAVTPAQISAWDGKVDQDTLTNALDSVAMTDQVSNGSVTFNNIDTSKAYDLYVEMGEVNSAAPVSIKNITVTTNSITYVLENASNGMNCKLREIKL